MAGRQPDAGEAIAALHSVSIVDDHFSAEPLNVKAAWPLYLPHDFEGRFTSADTLVVEGKTYTRQH